MRTPKHRRHVKGYGVVTLGGRDYTTGEFGTTEADREYRRMLGEYLSAGRVTPRETRRRRASDSVGRLAGEFAVYAEARFRKRGEPSSFARRIGRIAAEVGELYGETPVGEFGGTALMAIRDGWVRDAGGGSRMTRAGANEAARLIVRMFAWGVARDRVPPSVVAALEAVEPLTRRDRCREGTKVESVPLATVEDTLPFLGSVPATIVRLILATGMRPSEACAIRPMDLDRSGEAWVYRVDPDWDKTEWQGKRRVIYLGPRAQAILAGPVDRAASPSSYVFRPGPTSRRAGKNRPYLADTLGKCIERACVRGKITPWFPYALRHTALTAIHARLGMDAARVVGGHSSARTTIGYIDDDVATAADREKAMRAALDFG